MPSARSRCPPTRGSRRSNPATYTGALDAIRKAFAKEHGVKPGLFSANSHGACPECKGAGVIYLDFGFMRGQSTLCGACQGRRFNDDVLGYELGDKHIADVARLLNLLNSMMDQGTPVIVIDIGPGAGSAGGNVIFQGTPPALTQAHTPTGQHLSRAAVTSSS